MYDKDRARIAELLDLGVSQRRIIKKHLGYGTANSLSHYVRTRGLIKVPAQKTLKVELYLSVENNNKYVRGKTKARRSIEEFVLHQYDMKKPHKDGWEYILTIPYQTNDDLEQQIYDLLAEAESIADARHCFIEADVRAMDGSDRSW